MLVLQMTYVCAGPRCGAMSLRTMFGILVLLRSAPSTLTTLILMRSADSEDAPQGPRSALPRWPLRQPNDAMTRACARHARSIRGGPRPALHIVPAPWARPPSSSVAAKMCLPSFRRWPDQIFEAVDPMIIAQPPSLRSDRRSPSALAKKVRSPGRRGTSARDPIAQPPSLRSGRRSTCALAQPPSIRSGRGRRRRRRRAKPTARVSTSVLPLRTREPRRHGRRRQSPSASPRHSPARPRPRQRDSKFKQPRRAFAMRSSCVCHPVAMRSPCGCQRAGHRGTCGGRPSPTHLRLPARVRKVYQQRLERECLLLR